MPNTFQASPDDDERRMSMSAYGYYRLVGHSAEEAVILATESPNTPETYEQKPVIDNANSGEFRNVVGLKDEYKKLIRVKLKKSAIIRVSRKRKPLSK